MMALLLEKKKRGLSGISACLSTSLISRLVDIMSSLIWSSL